MVSAKYEGTLMLKRKLEVSGGIPACAGMTGVSVVAARTEGEDCPDGFPIESGMTGGMRLRDLRQKKVPTRIRGVEKRSRGFAGLNFTTIHMQNNRLQCSIQYIYVGERNTGKEEFIFELDCFGSEYRIAQ
jgi:hypothetical protein